MLSRWLEIEKHCLRRSQPKRLGSRDQLDNIGVRRCESGVECRESASSQARLRGQVRVGDLAVADDTTHYRRIVRHVVGPESVIRMHGRGFEEFDGIVGRYPVSDEESKKRALRDRRRCEESVGLGRHPVFCRLMVHVIFDRQGDQHIAIKKRCHASSSSSRTSSAVITRPSRIVLSPVRSLTDVTGAVCGLRTRPSSSLMVSLRV
jgi:hypothetical protein